MLVTDALAYYYLRNPLSHRFSPTQTAGATTLAG